MAVDGELVAQDLWEHTIYLGPDELIYELEARREGNEIVITLVRKQDLAEYLRFVARTFDKTGASLDPADCHHCAMLRLAELFWAKEDAPGQFGLESC